MRVSRVSGCICKLSVQYTGTVPGFELCIPVFLSKNNVCQSMENECIIKNYFTIILALCIYKIFEVKFYSCFLITQVNDKEMFQSKCSDTRSPKYIRMNIKIFKMLQVCATLQFRRFEPIFCSESFCPQYNNCL